MNASNSNKSSYNPPILSKLTVSPHPISSSPTCLTINQDGQFLILTRADLNIFTPAYGMQLDPRTKPIKGTGGGAGVGDNSSNSTGSLKGKEKEKVKRQTIPMFKTCITLSKNDKTDWSSWSDEERTFTGASGNTEVGWRASTWSPSGLATLGGCVIAGLSNNNEAIVYEPRRDAYKGEWVEVYDLTNHLTRLLLPDHNAPERDQKLEDTPARQREINMKVLECQVTCLSWSPQVVDASGDFSLLVLGHRSGHISLWRRWIDGKMDLLKRYRINDRAQWIISLAWSPWSLSKSGSKILAVSHLAVSDSQGGIWTTAITQDISSPRVALEKELGGEEEEEEEGKEEVDGISAEEPMEIGEKDSRVATALCWAVKGSVMKLVYTKLGTVNVVTFVVKKQINSVKSNVELEILTEGASQWVGANPLAVCCGIEYLPSSNSIVLALTSSSFHTFILSTPPKLATSSETQASSSELTALTRKAFSTVCSIGGNIPNKSIGASLYGFAKFSEDGAEMGYIYTQDTPNDLAAAIGINQQTQFILSSYLNDMQGEEHLARLERILSNPPNSRLDSPQATLQSFLHFLADNILQREFIDSVLKKLLLELDDEIEVDIEAVADSTPQSASINFREELYGHDVLEGLRLRESIARFILFRTSLANDQKVEAVAVQNQLCRQVNKYVLVRLSRVLASANPALQEFEMDVSGRILIASAALSTEPATPYDDGNLPSPYDLKAAFGAPENCPACDGAIPFQSIRSARCENGHEWERCSITLIAMSTVNVRTCTGCERKALLSFGKKEEQDSSIVSALLNASTCCLYCGGRWMRLR